MSSISLSGEVARHTYQTALANAEQARLGVVQNVKDNFFELLIAGEQRKVAEQNVKLATDIATIAQGRTKVLDYTNARIQRSQAVQQLIQAQAAERQAIASLNALLTMSPDQTTALVGDMLPPELNVSYGALEASALASHPQIRAAQETAAQAKMQVRLARSQANPTLGISYTHDLSTTPLYSFAGTVSIPLDWGQIRDTVRQQQRAELEKQEALRSATLTVNASLRTAFFNFQAAVLNVKSYREDVLEPSEHLMADTQRDFASGKASYLELLNAQQTLRLARTQYLQLLLTGRHAFDAVEAASGTPLENGDSPPAPPPPMDNDR